jgi:hypothetical protein
MLERIAEWFHISLIYLSTTLAVFHPNSNRRNRAAGSPSLSNLYMLLLIPPIKFFVTIGTHIVNRMHPNSKSELGFKDTLLAWEMPLST